MNAIRKYLSLLLAVALVVSCLAGCSLGRNSAPADEFEGLWKGPVFQYENQLPPVLEEPATLKNLASKTPATPQEKDYTVMVYMVGSNLESGDGAASLDLLEMLEAGVDLTRTNVVIMTGGAAYWHQNIPSDVNVIYELGAEELEAVASTESLMNMGDAATFLSFLNYASQNYPAKAYGLILWDHGAGPVGGFGNDELFGYDPLHLPEMQVALDASAFKDTKLAFVGYDACLMADLEVAALWQPYARYMIASQELEAGTGWDYSFLNTLNSGSVEDMAKAVLQTFEASMVENRWKPAYTLSWLDLTQLDSLNEPMNGLFLKMAKDAAGGNFSGIAGSRNAALRFGLEACDTLEESLDLVDITSVATALGSDYTAEAEAVRSALDSIVLSQVSNVEGTCGLSMYYPYDNKVRFTEQGGSLVVFEYNPITDFSKFVEGFAGYWLYNQADAQWVEQFQNTETAQSGDEILLQIPQDQAANMGKAYYSIMQYDPETDTYREVLSNCQVTPAEDGTLRIPKNPEVFLLKTDRDAEATLWPMTQLSQDRFASVNTVLLPSTQVISGGYAHIRIIVRTDAQGQPQIQDIISKSDEEAVLGKQNVDVSKWGALGTIVYDYYATTDDYGQLLPQSQWEKKSGYTIEMRTYGADFSITSAPLAEQAGEFICLLTLEDTSGNVIGVKQTLMQEGQAYTLVEIPVDEGQMVFKAYEDHAALVSYDGKVERLVIPKTVGENNVPVTVIAQGAAAYGTMSTLVLPDSITRIEQDAFQNCRRMKSVNLPTELEVIGMGAFAHTGLTGIQLGSKLTRIDDEAFAGSALSEVTLPDSLVYLGERVFAGCAQLRRIRVGENPVYKAVDGVVFTTDGKTLVAYPAGRSGSYTVPEGTEVIGPSAFNAATALTGVTFPEGLTTIGREAFQNVLGLTEITLPESLGYIGEAAFGASLEQQPEVTLPVVQIKAQVEHIGTGAFSGYMVEAFQVDEGNTGYSTQDGCLLNSSGTKLIQAPYGYSGALAVPAGVSYIGQDAFFRCDRITELAIPDSVVAISSSASLPKSLEKLSVGKGLASWKNLWDLPAGVMVEIHAANPNYTVKEGNIYSADGRTLLRYLGTEESFTLGDDVRAIHKDAFMGAAQLKELELGQRVGNLPNRVFEPLLRLQSLKVTAGSRTYMSEKGLLYTLDGKTLVAVPRAYKGNITLRTGTEVIGAYAFCAEPGFSTAEVIVPEGVTTLEQGNFINWYYVGEGPLKLQLPASLVNISRESLKNLNSVEVSAPAGSTAEAHAQRYALTLAAN